MSIILASCGRCFFDGRKHHLADDCSEHGSEAAKPDPVAAAAPAMLEALHDCIEEIRAWRKSHPHAHPDKPVVTTHVLNRASAAIAAAEGRS